MLSAVVWILVVLGLTNFGSILGAYGVFKYGTLDEYLNFFERTNKKYENELSSLRDMKHALRHDVHSVSHSVDKLKVYSADLHSGLKDFDEIRASLAAMMDSDSDDGKLMTVSELVDSLNADYAEMAQLAVSNRKASLLVNFYDVSTRDDVQGVNEQEWTRFLWRLPIEQRKEFEAKGTFQQLSNGDGVLDLNDFQEVVDDIVAECDEQMVACYGNTVQQAQPEPVQPAQPAPSYPVLQPQPVEPMADEKAPEEDHSSNEVFAWLKAMDMERYFSTLHENGLDSLDAVAEMTRHDLEQMKEPVPIKLAHRQLLLAAAVTARYAGQMVKLQSARHGTWLREHSAPKRGGGGSVECMLQLKHSDKKNRNGAWWMLEQLDDNRCRLQHLPTGAYLRMRKHGEPADAVAPYGTRQGQELVLEKHAEHKGVYLVRQQLAHLYLRFKEPRTFGYSKVRVLVRLTL